MNLEALIFDVRDDAQDHAEGQAWTDERIVRWLAEAEREACARKGLLFESDLAKMCEITTEAGRRSYAIDPRWVVITKAYLTAADSDRVIHLNLTSREVLDQQRPDWRTAARDPCELMVYDTRVEFGSPIDRDWLLHLEGWRLPLVPLGGEDGGDTGAVPEIAAIHHEYLRHWALYRGYSQPDRELFNPDKAKGALAEFERYFGARPDADQRRDWYQDTPHHNAAIW